MPPCSCWVCNAVATRHLPREAGFALGHIRSCVTTETLHDVCYIRRCGIQASKLGRQHTEASFVCSRNTCCSLVSDQHMVVATRSGTATPVEHMPSLPSCLLAVLRRGCYMLQIDTWLDTMSQR